MKQQEIEKFYIRPDSKIYQAIKSLENSKIGVALVVNLCDQLFGIITDGDVRRAILDEISLEEPVSILLKRKKNSIYKEPISASINMKKEKVLQLMQEYNINQIPLLDDQRKVVDLLTISDFIPAKPPSMKALIMAGGAGMRLRPLTENIPKPMLPVGNKPLLEILLKQLKNSDINEITISTYYKSDIIMDYFGNGKKLGVKLTYINEDKPLGTAGAIGLMPPYDEPLLVINGDLLTNVDFRAMHSFHYDNQPDMTIAVCQYRVKVPYGVLCGQGHRVDKILEKPTQTFWVNAGIYILSPRVYDYIQKKETLDMNQLIAKLIADKRVVLSFPIIEYWSDIGQHHTYQKVQDDIQDRSCLF